MLKAIVILIGLIVSTSIHVQPTSAWSQPGAYQAPQSTWNDDYYPPKSQWSSPKIYRALKSTWSTKRFAATSKETGAPELVDRSGAPGSANERVGSLTPNATRSASASVAA